MMLFKRKKQDSVEINDAPSDRSHVDSRINVTHDDYISCLMKCRAELSEELGAYLVAARSLKASAKRISHIRGVYSNKIPRRKMKRHGVKIKGYKESLDSYGAISSRIAWLLDTHASCTEGAASTAKSPRKESRIRKGAESYSKRILLKKKKIEAITDGIVMPVATYVN